MKQNIAFIMSMHIYTDDLRHCIYMPEATLMVRQDNDVCTEYYTSAHSYHISKFLHIYLME